MKESAKLKITALKPYVPAKDFELSKRFYAALGFSMSEGCGGTVDFTLNGYAFHLQDYYVQDWANNFMFVIGVEDVHGWHKHAEALLASNDFSGMRVKAPEQVDSSLVLHVWDPSGVLLIFVQ